VLAVLVGEPLPVSLDEHLVWIKRARGIPSKTASREVLAKVTFGSMVAISPWCRFLGSLVVSVAVGIHFFIKVVFRTFGGGLPVWRL